MLYFAEIDADCRVLGILGVAGSTPPTSAHTLVALADATLPAKNSEHDALFLRNAVLIFEDPRSPAMAWADVRTERDRLLAASDWTVTRAVETGASLPTAWSTYRQALRDITLQADPFHINWPTPPTA